MQMGDGILIKENIISKNNLAIDKNKMIDSVLTWQKLEPGVTNSLKLLSHSRSLTKLSQKIDSPAPHPRKPGL